MNTWKAYVQINGEDVSYYPIYHFAISDELFDKITTAIDNGIKLRDADFYEELESKGEACIDLISVIDDEEAPEREDYESDEEYKAALDEYEEELWDDYCLMAVDIDDPGDTIRLANSLVGKQYLNWESDEEHDEEFEFDEDDERIVHYSVTISFDKDGIIKDVGEVVAEALEYESVRHSSYSSCYPDYNFVEKALIELLEEG